MSREFQQVGVVGLGTMGAGIAEVLARTGIGVIGVEIDEEAAQRGRAHVENSTARAVSGGKMTAEQQTALLDRISYAHSLDALRDVDLVVEAVPEHLDLKAQIFAQLDKICKPEAILASNTSSLSVTEIAVATGRPGKVVGMHFFNPAPVMKLVEVVKTVRTSDETADAVFALANKLAKHPVVCPDRAGFIVNALLFPYINDATKMLESGYATAEDIDTAMKLGCGHPMGPFALADIVGLDVTYQIIQTLYDEFRDPYYAPAPMLEHLVTAGFLGRKTKRGFYSY
jgi:3-hydroxybutyryl-CoA dehydrogenase